MLSKPGKEHDSRVEHNSHVREVKFFLKKETLQWPLSAIRQHPQSLFCPKDFDFLGLSTLLSATRLKGRWPTTLQRNKSMYPDKWSRKWQPSPVFLPGEPHGQRSLVGCSPWGRQESDTTAWLTFSRSTRRGQDAQFRPRHLSLRSGGVGVMRARWLPSCYSYFRPPCVCKRVCVWGGWGVILYYF